MSMRHIWSIPQNMVRYVAEAVTRIFRPDDDDYPKTGVQPFEGEPGEKERW